MKSITMLDLSRYEKMYENFDAGHNKYHCIAVRKMSVSLAKKYAPDQIKLAYIAATLHDIGLSVDRENHEIHGEEIIKKDDYLKSKLSRKDFKEICHAVREHRASVGKPQTILAKIISDADRMGGYCSSKKIFLRSYSYELQKNPDSDPDQRIIQAAKYLANKFSKNSYGSRVYFEETQKRLNKYYGPIVNAYKKGNLEYLKSLVKSLLK